MVMRNTLVLLSGDDTGSVVEAAFQVSDKSRSRITGLHLSGDAVFNMPAIVEGMSERQVRQQFDRARMAASEAEQQSRAQFDAACERHGAIVNPAEAPARSDGISAYWHVASGRADKVLPEMTRTYDLLVSGAAGTVAGDSIVGAVEVALFDAGRPVLVVPRETPRTVGRHVMIGWNRSAVAARAVTAALPFIQAAEKVTICQVATGARAGPDADILAQSLAWHDVDATVRHVSPGGVPIVDQLVSEAANSACDLMVMGAYSHSRMREFVLGGVTRHALRHVVMPLLLMH